MFNKVILIGRVTRDIEYNKTANGIAVAKFGLAVQRNFANENGEKEADFIDCVAFTGRADTINKYVKKGDLFAVYGRLDQQRWEDDKGDKRSKIVVNVDDFQFLSGSSNQSTATFEPQDGVDPLAQFTS